MGETRSDAQVRAPAEASSRYTLTLVHGSQCGRCRYQCRYSSSGGGGGGANDEDDGDDGAGCEAQKPAHVS